MTAAVVARDSPTWSLMITGVTILATGDKIFYDILENICGPGPGQRSAHQVEVCLGGRGRVAGGHPGVIVISFMIMITSYHHDPPPAAPDMDEAGPLSLPQLLDNGVQAGQLRHLHLQVALGSTR